MSTRDFTASNSSDPMNPFKLFEDLINNHNEWRAAPEIIRLTIRALSNALVNQSNQLKDLKFMQSQAISRPEFISALALKANLSDLSSSISDIRGTLDNKISYEELRQIDEDKLSRSEFKEILKSKLGYEHLRDIEESKMEISRVRSEGKEIREIINDSGKKIEDILQHVAWKKDFVEIMKELEGKANRNEVGEALGEKASKSSVGNAMQKKANRIELDQIRRDLRNSVNNLQASIDVQVRLLFDNLSEELLNKADRGSFKQVVVDVSNNSIINDLEKMMLSLSSAFRENEREVQQQYFIFEGCLSDLKSEVESFKFYMNTSLESKADITDIERLNTLVCRKSDSEDLKYLNLAIKNECDSLIRSHQSAQRQELKRMEKSIQENSLVKETHLKLLENDLEGLKSLFNQSSEKIKTEIINLMKHTEKARNEEFRLIRYDLEKIQIQIDDFRQIKGPEERRSLSEDLFEKVNIFEIKLAELSQVCNEIQNTAPQALPLPTTTNEFNSFNSQLQTLEFITKELQLRPSLPDIQSLLLTKADTSDIIDLQKALTFKVSAEDFIENLQKQGCINEALCAENCVGRWLWKSGGLKTGKIPWEVQTINTCLENFKWKKGKVDVVVIKPGLYQVCFGIFPSQKVEIKLLVNNEEVISEFGCLGKALGLHPSGNVTGYTCNEYLSLPAKASLSLAYIGEPSEGFFSLWKL